MSPMNKWTEVWILPHGRELQRSEQWATNSSSELFKVHIHLRLRDFNITLTEANSLTSMHHWFGELTKCLTLKWWHGIWISIHCQFHIWLHKVLHKVYTDICICWHYYWCLLFSIWMIKHSPIQYSEVFPSTSNNLQENLSTVYYKQKSTCWCYSANPYIWGLNLLAHLLQTERTPTEYHGTDFCLALLESIYMHVGAWHCIKLSYPLVKSKFYTYLEQCKWLETAHWLWAPMLQ